MLNIYAEEMLSNDFSVEECDAPKEFFGQWKFSSNGDDQQKIYIKIAA